MEGPNDRIRKRGRVLLAVAAPREAQAVLRGLGASELMPKSWRILRVDDRFDLILTGVGKANAAGAVSSALDPARHRGVVNLGVAGALPDSGLDLGAVVLATTSVFADEGIITPMGYQDLASMGFAPTPDGMAIEGTRWLLDRFGSVCEAKGPIATVSLCSGDDDAALEVVSRTGAIAETMEGAAVGLATLRRGLIAEKDRSVAFAELRVVSNTTGRRDRQRWALDAAMDRLAALSASLGCIYKDASTPD